MANTIARYNLLTKNLPAGGYVQFIVGYGEILGLNKFLERRPELTGDVLPLAEKDLDFAKKNKVRIKQSQIEVISKETGGIKI